MGFQPCPCREAARAFLFMRLFRSWTFDLGLALTLGGAVATYRAIDIALPDTTTGLGAVAGTVSAGVLLGITAVLAGIVLMAVGAYRARRP